ncbi:MAG: hypothetical protein LBI43_00395 [Streptococcaceae bacterium]|nr:hypothetical protein [Streptococcaceae bacterium]
MMRGWTSSGGGWGNMMNWGNGSGSGFNWIGMIGGGILSLLVVGVVIWGIWYVTTQHQGWSNGSHPHEKSLSDLTDSELEAELEKRKSNASMASEIADLKAQIEELKKKSE